MGASPTSSCADTRDMPCLRTGPYDSTSIVGSCEGPSSRAHHLDDHFWCSPVDFHRWIYHHLLGGIIRFITISLMDVHRLAISFEPLPSVAIANQLVAIQVWTIWQLSGLWGPPNTSTCWSTWPPGGPHGGRGGHLEWLDLVGFT